MDKPELIHATCVAIDDHAVLLTGKSGSGKSDLALRLIELGGVLVSDDQVALLVKNRKIYASPPVSLAGLLEVRGVGICKYDYLEECLIVAIISLQSGCQPERLPDLEFARQQILGVSVASFVLDPFESSTTAKIAALVRLTDKL